MNNELTKEVRAIVLHIDSIPTGASRVIRKLANDGFIIGLVVGEGDILEHRVAQVGLSVSDFTFVSMNSDRDNANVNPRTFEPTLNQLSEMGISNEQSVIIGNCLADYHTAKYHHINFIAVLQNENSTNAFLGVDIDNNLILNNIDELEGAIKKLVLINTYRRSLQNSSVIDGRYGATTSRLKHYFSEYAFHKYRVKAEIEHLIALSEFFKGVVVRPLSGHETKYLNDLAENFNLNDAYEVLQYDHLGRNGIGPVEHDTKAIELWLQEKLENTTLYDIVPSIHIFLTSEDIRNIAHKLMLRGAMDNIFSPSIYKIGDQLQGLTQEYLGYPLMARTHFQPASPTTFGKIFGTYLARLTQALERVDQVKLFVKVNGAVGNYNSFTVAYPELDWIGYSKYLAKKVNFPCFLWTDQRGPHNDVVGLFQSLQEVGNVLRSISIDLSLYAGLDLIYFSKVESHVGSSVMPHKINPWFAEVAEGSLSKLNYLINGLSADLDVSRLQRDLSDHAWERSYGEIFGALHLAISNLSIALNMLNANTEYAKKELDNNPQVVTEAMQTILRKHKVAGAYDMLKTAFRGGRVTTDDLNNFIDRLNISEEIKKELKNTTDPKKYIGLAPELARSAINYYEGFKEKNIS